MLRRILIGVAFLLALLVAGVAKTLWDVGAFKTLEPHFSGECRRVAGAPGPEDLTIHPRTGVAYVSGYDRRAALRGEPVGGAIYAYDTNAAQPRLVPLTPGGDSAFRPHGLSLWVGPDGREVLFVINHPASDSGAGKPQHSVEVFDLRGGRLEHRTTLRDPELLVMPNDLVAVGPDRFYLTNTHANPPGPAQTRETYLRLAGAKVVFFDGERFRPALEDLIFPNGINVSADGRTLYIATTTPRKLLVYDRDPEHETLEPREEVFLGSGLDNVELDAEGRVWIGAHPKMLAIAGHGRDPEQKSPSQVLRVERDANGVYQVSEIYLNEGEQISGSSVAAVRGKRMLIGQIFDDGILDCTLQ